MNQLPTEIPPEVSSLVDETLRLVRAHPQHEMGQNQRRKIYQALAASPQGERAARWLAVLSVRHVQPVYQEAVAASPYAGDPFVVHLLDRVLAVAEQVMNGALTADDVRQGTRTGAIEDFYHSILVAAEDDLPDYVWLAAMAADYARLEAMGYRPLETLISGEVVTETGKRIITRSSTWSDDRLAGSGAHADDASVDAAYAYARRTARGVVDASRLLEFWEWWLSEAIPTAWKLAE